MSGGSDSTSYSDFPSVQIPERVLHSISHCGKKITLTGFRCGQALYIYMSNKTLLNLSKQCLVSFLDYAQEELKLQAAAIFFDRSVSDYRKVMRNFSFFGFQLVSSDQLPSLGDARQGSEVAQKYHFMLYELESETDDEES